MDCLSVVEYMLHAKTLSDHLTAASEVIFEHEMVLYILYEVGPRYLTFVTTFNMTQIKPSIGMLQN